MRKLRERIHSEEKGFTLIELLVVILIIGILAAIALPAFLGQRTKGQDASAKSNARNMVSEIESCFADEQTYGDPCNAAATYNGTGLPVVAGAPAKGQVGIVSGSGNSFVITARSESDNTFTVTKTSGGAPVRTCGTKGNGGCPSSGSW